MVAHAPFLLDGLDDPAWAGPFEPSAALTLPALGSADRARLATRIRLGELVCASRGVNWHGQRRLAAVPDMNLVIGSWMTHVASMAATFSFWGTGLPPVLFGGAKPTRAKVRWLNACLLRHLEEGTPLPEGAARGSL